MPEQDFLARLKDAGRNDACPCGSGKKYKKCHLAADDEANRALSTAKAEAAAKTAEAVEKEAGEAGKPEASAKPAVKQTHNTPAGPAKPAGAVQANKPVGAPRKMV